MKPSEMSTSRLSAAIDHWLLELNIENTPLNELVEEMETRLRNSIPKPVVEVVGMNSRDPRENYALMMNRAIMGIYREKHTADAECKTLRTALGLEGGE